MAKPGADSLPTAAVHVAAHFEKMVGEMSSQKQADLVAGVFQQHGITQASEHASNVTPNVKPTPGIEIT